MINISGVFLKANIKFRNVALGIHPESLARLRSEMETRENTKIKGKQCNYIVFPGLEN